jgi:hypothetical protein
MREMMSDLSGGPSWITHSHANLEITVYVTKVLNFR